MEELNENSREPTPQKRVIIDPEGGYDDEEEVSISKRGLREWKQKREHYK